MSSIHEAQEQATKDPAAEPTEQWLNRTVGHSWLVAYHSGRLFNAVSFHVLQAFMLFHDESTLRCV